MCDIYKYLVQYRHAITNLLRSREYGRGIDDDRIIELQELQDELNLEVNKLIDY
jgi:hypothetical protein